MGENDREPPDDADEFDAPEGVRSYIRHVYDRYAEAPTQFAKELIAGKRRVFFYAGSGLDLQPLHRFTHLADTFVFADPRKTEAAFSEARQRLMNRQTKAGNGLVAVTEGLDPVAAYGVVAEVAGELAVTRDEPWTRIPNPQDRLPWGAVQRLKRYVGGTERDLWLVFVAGSPLIAYRRLFVETGTAPVCLAMCVPRVDHADPADGLMEALVNPHDHAPIEEEWSALMGWEGELGELLRENNAPLPKLLAADEPMAWQTHGFWYRVTRWRCRYVTPVLAMRNEPWPELAPVPAGRRRVAVTRRPVNPLTARSVEAIVMNHITFQQYRWPDGLLVILVGPPLFPDEVVPDGPGVLNLDIGGIPLLQALAELERVCAERGISRVAVQEPLGFEDEADDLALWRQQEGQIRELTLHADSDGHLLDFGQVADKVD